MSAAGLLLVAGCRKDDLVDCAPATAPLVDFSRRHSVPVQTFRLALGTTQTITTARGTTFTFPANSLLLPTGGVATDTARVRIREIYTVPDMILADMPTDVVRRGNMLVSGGEFSIQVWQKTSRLRLAPGQTVAVQTPIPADQDTTPQLVWQQPAAVMASDSAGWQQAATTAVQTLPGLYRAALPLDSIGWWNIDQFWHVYSNVNSALVTVKTPVSAVGATRVYLRPVGYNGLLKLWPTTQPGTTWQKDAPLGAEMIAVVIQSVGGQLYYGTQRLTISNGVTISPVVSAVSEAEAVRLIRQL
jgi:hypothetical protein